MQKVLLSTGSIYTYGLNRIFEIAKETGFDGIELLLRSKLDAGYVDTWDFEYLRSLEIKNNIKIYSIHIPFEIEISENPDLILDEVKKLAKKLGVKTLILHVPRLDQIEYNKWFKKQKLKSEKEFCICVENMFREGEKADPIHVEPKEFGRFSSVCLDTAHSMRGNINPNKFLVEIANVKHIHCSNWDGEEDHLSIQNNEVVFNALYGDVGETVETITVELCPKAFKDIFNRKEISELLKNEVKFIKTRLKKEKT